MSRLWSLLVALVVVVMSPRAKADDRDEARRHAERGIELYDAGRLEKAQKALLEAERLHAHPVHRVYLARILERRGRLVAAQERYLSVVDLEGLDGGAAEAQRAAREELEALNERLPRLVVDIRADDPASVEVRVDGRRVHAARLAEGLPLDPGTHVLVIRGGGSDEPFELPFELGQGDRRRETVSRRGSGTGLDVPPDHDETNENAGSDAMMAWGGALLAIGGASAVAALVTGILTLTRSSDVRDRCDGNECPPEVSDDLDEARRLATATTALLAISGIFGGVGAGLMIGAAVTDDETSASLTVTVRF